MTMTLAAADPSALTIIFIYYLVLSCPAVPHDVRGEPVPFPFLYGWLVEHTADCPAMDSAISQRTSSPCSERTSSCYRL
jgi:hypothetical protein